MKKLLFVLTLFVFCTGMAFAGAKVFITKNASEADYKVYITEHSTDEKNASILKDAKLVKNQSESDILIYITEYRSAADIVISEEHFPK